MSVLSGWIATIGAMALVAPAVAVVLAASSIGNNDIAPAVPVVIGIFISYLIGGYVPGRVAGEPPRSPRVPTAFFYPFLLPVLVLVGLPPAGRGFFRIRLHTPYDSPPPARPLHHR